MGAARAPILFENYAYGMSRDEVMARSGATACPEAGANSLLLCAPGPVKFLGLDWREMFWLNNLGELQQIILNRSDDSAGSLAALRGALAGAGWRPVLLETDGAVLDLLEQASRNEENAESVREDFVARALREGTGLTIHFFPADLAQKLMGKAGSYAQGVDRAGENIVLISLMLTDGNMKLAFTAPLLSRKNALRYGQMIKR